MEKVQEGSGDGSQPTMEGRPPRMQMRMEWTREGVEMERQCRRGQHADGDTGRRDRGPTATE